MQPASLPYDKLVDACRACNRCPGMGNPRNCEHPSTWAYLEWRGRRLASSSPRLLVVGQDPAGLDKCSVQFPSWLPGDNPTNRNLRILLEATGLQPSEVHLTNAVLCMKPGGMGAAVEKTVQENCRHWLAQTIQVLRPQAVAALGGNALGSLCSLYGLRRVSLAASVKPTPEVTTGSLAVFARYHCGPSGTNPSRGGRLLDAQIEDWRAIGAWLRDHPRT